MPYPIPRIEYKSTTLFGSTTNASNQITGLSSVVGLAIGMVVSGPGIPAGTTVTAVGTSSVTISVGATGTNSGGTYYFAFVVLFPFPPIEDTGPTLSGVSTKNTSIAGVNQVVTSYLQETREIDFRFLPLAVKNLVNNFYLTWGLFGKTFRYYDDTTLNSYIVYECDKPQVVPKKAAGRLTWQITITLRRAL